MDVCNDSIDLIRNTKISENHSRTATSVLHSCRRFFAPRSVRPRRHSDIGPGFCETNRDRSPDIPTRSSYQCHLSSKHLIHETGRIGTSLNHRVPGITTPLVETLNTVHSNTTYES